MKMMYFKKIVNIIREDIFSDSGFSLIEVLVAIAISSVILLLIYSVHSSITLAIHNFTGVADFYENVDLAINRIDRDISCSYFNRNNKKLCFIGECDNNTPYNGKLNFVTVDYKDFFMLINPKEQYHRSDIREVGYFLEPDDEIQDLFYLMRREENHYDDDPESGGESSILLENVVDLKFEFRKGNDWTNNWDSREHQRFPKTIRTTLKVRNYSEKDEEFIFISYINLKK